MRVEWGMTDMPFLFHLHFLDIIHKTVCSIVLKMTLSNEPLPGWIYKIADQTDALYPKRPFWGTLGYYNRKLKWPWHEFYPHNHINKSSDNVQSAKHYQKINPIRMIRTPIWREISYVRVVLGIYESLHSVQCSLNQELPKVYSDQFWTSGTEIYSIWYGNRR